jgi:hypothetical protein
MEEKEALTAFLKQTMISRTRSRLFKDSTSRLPDVSKVSVVEFTSEECDDLVVFGTLLKTSMLTNSSNLDWAIITPEDPDGLFASADNDIFGRSIKYISTEVSSTLLKTAGSPTYEEAWAVELNNTLSRGLIIVTEIWTLTRCQNMAILDPGCGY